MENHYNIGRRHSKKTSSLKIFIFLVLIALVALLGFFSATQFITAQSLQNQLKSLDQKIDQLQEEQSEMQNKYDEIYEENERLREENQQLHEENKMMRSESLIEHGNRETDKVAITIDDGGSEAVNLRALDYLRELGVSATLFPTGQNVEAYPESWKRAVQEGHELGNHTYSHPFLSNLSEERVREELSGWQEAVDNVLGEAYHTLFFRPPYGDGFLAGQDYQRERLQPIVAEEGMFPIMWDVELVYALRNEAYTASRITEHVLQNARGGSIVLLHFTEADIEALPNIIHGLRERGLEPCSLRELLLAEPQS